MYPARTVILIALLCAACSPLAASDACKDCDPVTGLTVRETIVKERAEEARRRLGDREPRPWEGEKGREAFGRPEGAPKPAK